MKVFLFVILGTILEARGDAIIRLSMHSDAPKVRLGLFLLGAILLTLYGTTLNLAPVEFGTLTGLYVATVFIGFQVTNYIFFRAAPHTPTLISGTLILTGGMIIYFWR